MQVLLAGTFYIADAVSSFLKVLSTEEHSIQQQTQEAVLHRAEWPTFFTSRASRRIPLVYPVQWPPCATDAEAMEQARVVFSTCPNGGSLVETLGSRSITYEDCKIDDISCRRTGVSNFFTFRVTAINPTTATLSTLAQMDSRYIANLSSLTGLTGGTATDLDSLTTTDVAVGFTAFVLTTIGGVVQPKHFRLIAGTTAENTDPTAGLLVVRPDDYHASTNAKVWVEVG